MHPKGSTVGIGYRGAEAGSGVVARRTRGMAMRFGASLPCEQVSEAQARMAMRFGAPLLLVFLEKVAVCQKDVCHGR